MAKSKFIDLLGLSAFKDKIIDIIPTKTSQLENDSGFTTNESVGGIVYSESEPINVTDNMTWIGNK